MLDQAVTAVKSIVGASGSCPIASRSSRNSAMPGLSTALGGTVGLTWTPSELYSVYAE